MAFLTGKELKIYLIIVAALTILALSATLIIMTVKRGSRTYREDDAGPSADLEIPSSDTLLDPVADVLHKICIPDEYAHLYAKEWKPFRPVHERWTPEMIEPYWIDPQELVREELEKQTDREIARFFEGIP